MKFFPIALVAVLALASTAPAQKVEMGDISAKCYLTVVYDQHQTDIEQKLKAELYREGSPLSSLRSQCVFNEWSTGDRILEKTAWSEYLGNQRPILMLQGMAEADDTADVIFIASGSDLYNHEILFYNIGIALKSYAKWLAMPVEQRGRWGGQCGPQGCPTPQYQQQQQNRPINILDDEITVPIPDAPPEPRKTQPVVDIDLPWLDIDIFDDEDEEIPHADDVLELPEEVLEVADDDSALGKVISYAPVALAVLGGLAGGGGVGAGAVYGVRALLRRRKRTKDRKRGALRLAGWAKSRGLPLVERLLEDYAVDSKNDVIKSVGELLEEIEKEQINIDDSAEGELALLGLLKRILGVTA